MPPVIPAPKLLPTSPKITTLPPVMYSHPLSPHPSITACAPEFLTAKRSPAIPAAYKVPLVAPYSTVLPIMTFLFVCSDDVSAGVIIILPPDNPFAT